MRILTLTVLLGLPLMALGQQAEPQQTQGQTKETQTTAPTKGSRPNRRQNLRRAQAYVDNHKQTLRVALRR
jgi:hypothetical protein